MSERTRENERNMPDCSGSKCATTNFCQDFMLALLEQHNEEPVRAHNNSNNNNATTMRARLELAAALLPLLPLIFFTLSLSLSLYLARESKRARFRSANRESKNKIKNNLDCMGNGTDAMRCDAIDREPPSVPPEHSFHSFIRFRFN